MHDACPRGAYAIENESRRVCFLGEEKGLLTLKLGPAIVNCEL